MSRAVLTATGRTALASAIAGGNGSGGMELSEVKRLGERGYDVHIERRSEDQD